MTLDEESLLRLMREAREDERRRIIEAITSFAPRDSATIDECIEVILALLPEDDSERIRRT